MYWKAIDYEGKNWGTATDCNTLMEQIANTYGKGFAGGMAIKFVCCDGEPETLENRVATLLENAIFNTFVEIHREELITNGDISPFDSLKLDQIREELTNHIVKIIKFEKRTNKAQ